MSILKLVKGNTVDVQIQSIDALLDSLYRKKDAGVTNKAIVIPTNIQGFGVFFPFLYLF
jgi:hypothetical protein